MDGVGATSGPALFPPELAWSHYLVLMRVTKATARAFYEIEAARGSWSVRQLERQIGAQLFERLARNRSPDEVLALARRGQEVAKPQDAIKDPFVLEFLDLGEPASCCARNRTPRSVVSLAARDVAPRQLPYRGPQRGQAGCHSRRAAHWSKLRHPPRR
jgi:hypothetical protein